jgi:hypothetical protein
VRVEAGADDENRTSNPVWTPGPDEDIETTRSCNGFFPGRGCQNVRHGSFLG